MDRSYLVKRGMFICGVILGSATIVHADDEIMYDTDTGSWAVDTDGDTFPDVTEKLGGTDPFDAKDYPGADMNKGKKSTKITPQNVAGFPAASCRSGFRQAGSRLCISRLVQNAARYDIAILLCRDQRARVATYGDLFYLYLRTSLDATYNPRNKWIGNMVADDTALYGNRSITFNNDPDMWNFEGKAGKTNRRTYWCAHDDET